MSLELGLNFIGNASADNFMGEDSNPFANEDTIENEPVVATTDEKEKNIELSEEEVEEESSGSDFLSENLGSSNTEDVDDTDDIDDKNASAEEGLDSPTDKFYSTIAKTLSADGIFTIGEEDIKSIKSPEDLADAFKKQVKSMLEEQQQRISEALELDIPKEDIKQFEGVINFLNNIDEQKLREETDEAIKLRANLIYQDFLNSGMSKERADKLVRQSVEAGNDIDDAIEALSNNKKYYTDNYAAKLNESKAQREKQQNAEKEQLKTVEKMFLETEEPIKGVKLSQQERKKIFNEVTKIVDKDKSGKPLTAIQKYALDNPVDYQYKLNLLYHLTDGFKDLAPVIKDEVKKTTKSAMANLDKALKTPSGYSSLEDLKFGNSRDSNSTKGYSVVLD